MADKTNKIKTIVEIDANKANAEITKVVGNAESSVNDLNKTLGDNLKVTKNTAKAQESFNKSLETSSKGTSKLSEATGGLNDKFKLLAANPILLALTALVGIFTALKAAVGRSGKASETFGKIGSKISGIFNGLLAILEPLVEFIGEKLLFAIENPKQAFNDLADVIKNNVMNRIKGLMGLGEALAELFKGNFKRAGEIAKDSLLKVATGLEDAEAAVKSFAKEAVKRYEEASSATEKLANAEKRLARNRIAAEKQQLTSLRLAEEQRQIRDDESKSIEERIEANKRLGQILDEQSQREMALAQQALNLARLQQQATGDTIENLEAVGDAEIKLLEIRERITGQRSEQLVNENALMREQAELKQAEIDAAVEEQIKFAEMAQEEAEAEEEKRLLDQEIQNELDELEIERLREQGEKVLDLELALLERKRIQDVSAKDLTENQIALINKKSENEKNKIRRAEEKAEKAKEDAVLNNAINGAAEAFGIQQEVAVARMIMAAPEGIANSFKQAAQSYVPPLSIAMGALGAAGIVVPIVKGLADIKKARFSKKGKGGGSANTSQSISTSSASGGGGGAASAASSAITPEVVSDIAANNSARLGLDTGIGSAAGAAASNNVVGSSGQGVVFSEGKYNEFQEQVSFKEDKTTIG